MKNILNYAVVIIFLWISTGYTAFSQIKYTDDSKSVNVAIVHYELDLNIDYSAEKIIGKAGLTLQNISDKPIKKISLLLYRLLSVESVGNATVEPLEFEQKVVSFDDVEKMQVNYIQIELDSDLLPEEKRLLNIEYKGHMLGYSEMGYRYVKDHVSPEFTIIRNDARAFPLPGVPSRKINRQAPFPSFTYLARITVPDTLVVANGGELLQRKADNGSITYIYKSLKPSWRMDFAITRYKQSEKNGIRIFYFPEDSVGASGVMQAAQKSYDLFKSWFGSPEVESTLTFIEIPNGWGSQKDAVTIIQSAAAFKDPKRHREVYHEISHIWNVNPLDNPSPRWNEGLASFLEYLAIEHIEGREITKARADLLIRWLKESAKQNPKWTEIPMIDYGQVQLTDLSYSVGALMFDLLYRLVGQKEFNAIIGFFYHKYASAGATTNDFIAYANETSKFDLTDFFQDWVYTTNWYKRISEVQSISELESYYRETN